MCYKTDIDRSDAISKYNPLNYIYGFVIFVAILFCLFVIPAAVLTTNLNRDEKILFISISILALDFILGFSLIFAYCYCRRERKIVFLSEDGEHSEGTYPQSGRSSEGTYPIRRDHPGSRISAEYFGGARASGEYVSVPTNERYV